MPLATLLRERAMSPRLLPIARDGSVAAPVELPPPAREACEMTAQLYVRSGFEPPWTGYVAVREGVVVGTCAFKSAPRDDRVEIAYSTMPSHEGRGIATAMARALIEIARVRLPEVTITAQTLPEENASTAILRKLGFAHAGLVHTTEDGDVWEWHLHPGFRLR
jgi:RimJ/RimL family protein N-acetyltransferase